MKATCPRMTRSARTVMRAGGTYGDTTGPKPGDVPLEPQAPYILIIEMSLLHRLALRVGWELARRPEARAKAAEALTRAQRVLKDDIRPRARRAWQDAQPEIEHAKHRLARLGRELRDQYRKGRDGA